MLRLFITPNHGKYIVTDDKGRTIYSIKRRIRGGYVIRDANKYELYVLLDGTEERHPVYQILLNDKPAAEYKCRSKFLDPRMELKHGENVVSFRVADEKRMYYKIFCKEKEIGSLTAISVSKTITGASKPEYKYEMRVDEEFFEDFFPLLPLATLDCMII